ncbi:uncharacterized protein LOC128092307 [Culex pipiens pallens]|uniref:uncharacterized protein LOC128092307 n=1 Tax=Culex pipiens pallens TaxID=42434 RepID=UPI0022AACDDD|nr:uncharacterized protein LOC128092307 [Culex pipiens pallens]
MKTEYGTMTDVAAMMSCPLPLPLPLLPPALHADFPPVHIGVKRGLSFFEVSLSPWNPLSRNPYSRGFSSVIITLDAWPWPHTSGGTVFLFSVPPVCLLPYSV